VRKYFPRNDGEAIAIDHLFRIFKASEGLASAQQFGPRGEKPDSSTANMAAHSIDLLTMVRSESHGSSPRFGASIS
jgi:hypothetical protein